MQPIRTDVAIIGGGMVGVSIGLACLERGLSVTLYDPGERRRRASYGNAGAISRGSLFPVASPSVMKGLLQYATNRNAGLRIDYANVLRVLPWITHFLRASNETAWRRAAAALDPFVAGAYAEHERLAALAGASHLLARDGWLKLFRTQQAFATSQLERDILADHTVKVELLDAAAIRILEPALKRPFAAGILFPQTGHVRDPGGLLDAYEALFVAKGGVRLAMSAEAITQHNQGCTIEAAVPVHAGKVVLAAGAWSDGLARRLGYAFPMAAERGYHRHFTRPDGPHLTRTIYDTGGAYVAAPMEQGIRVLSGVELAPRDAPANPAQIEHAVTEARGTLDLGAPVENEPWLGSRPSTPDGLPIIGWAPRHRDLCFAFGHGHIGLSTGPVTGNIVADLLTGRQPAIPASAFKPERFL